MKKERKYKKCKSCCEFTILYNNSNNHEIVRRKIGFNYYYSNGAKEVADRLTAIPGSKKAGAITYSVYYYAEAFEILEVLPENFIPAPEVTSEVIQFKIRKELPICVDDDKKLLKLLNVLLHKEEKHY